MNALVDISHVPKVGVTGVTGVTGDGGDVGGGTYGGAVVVIPNYEIYHIP